MYMHFTKEEHRNWTEHYNQMTNFFGKLSHTLEEFLALREDQRLTIYDKQCLEIQLKFAHSNEPETERDVPPCSDEDTCVAIQDYLDKPMSNYDRYECRKEDYMLEIIKNEKKIFELKEQIKLLMIDNQRRYVILDRLLTAPIE